MQGFSDRERYLSKGMSRPVVTRRMFLGGMASIGCAAFPVNHLFAAMKYDRKGVLDLFRLRRDDTDARVKAGIEANRKGSVLFSFVDATGKPLEHVHVKLRQVSHDFKYGANLFMLGEFKSAELNKAYAIETLEPAMPAETVLRLKWLGIRIVEETADGD